MPEFCHAERDGRIFTVTIDRPEVMNALHPPANQELEALFDEFAKDDELWVAIITGAGERAFSAGNDLKYTASQKGKVNAPQAQFGGITERFDCPKPIIAAVNGIAMGGGFEIALACDLIIASDRAVFALPEPRVGLAALAGGVHRLPREIGVKRAMSLLLTGRHVPAKEGFELGFVNEVVPHDELMSAARRWADQVLECSPVSIRATKEAAMRGLDHAGVADAMADRYPAVGALYNSEDVKEGPRAFAEKRPPQWKGR